MLPKVLKPQEMVKNLGSPEIDVLQVPQLGRNCPFQIVILKPQLLQERKLPQRRRNGPVQHVILQVPEKRHPACKVARSILDDDNKNQRVNPCAPLSYSTACLRMKVVPAAAPLMELE